MFSSQGKGRGEGKERRGKGLYLYLYLCLLLPRVVGAAEPDSTFGVQEIGGVFAKQDSAAFCDVCTWMVEPWDNGDSLIVLGARHVADMVRWAREVWTDSYMMWGRPVSVDVRGRSGHRLQVWVDGWEVPDWDAGGGDLYRIPLEDIRSLQLDRARGRLCIRTTVPRANRPRTVIGRQVGSHQWTYTGVVFERPLWSDMHLYVAGHEGQVVDRGSGRGCTQKLGKIALDRRSKDKRWRMHWSILREISSRGVPGPYALHIGRTLWDRWTRWAMRLDRTVGRRGGLGLRGQIDALHRRLHRPDVGRDVDRRDVDGEIWLEGGLWSERHAVQGRMGGRWRTFTDTEEPDRREDQRQTWSIEIEDVLRMSGTTLRGWGALRYDSKFGTRGTGGVQGEREIERGREGERERETGPCPPRVVLSAGAGWTSRCPTFDELYWERYDVVDSMRVLPLKEEYGLRGWIGARGRIEGMAFHAFAFAGRGGWDGITLGSDGRYANHPRTVERGWKLGVSARLGACVGVEGAYAYRCARAKEEGVWPYVPTHRGKVRIQWWGSYIKGELKPRLSGGVEYVSVRWGYEPNGTRVRLDEGLFVQVGLEARILTDVQAFCQMDNLLDVPYEEHPGYPAEGRSFRWGLRWTLWD